MAELDDNSACPRCGGGFHCGADEGTCACFGLRLSDTLKQQLSAQYPGRCLCLRCLAELAATTALAAHHPSDQNPPGC